LADAVQPNRTFGSFVEGKDRKSRDSILVRGYWGDVVQSPYLTFGLEVDKEPERTKFFREINYQKVYSAADISLYIVQRYIHKLQELEDYDFPFERIKHIEEQYGYNDKDKKKKENEEEEKEEPKIQELTEEEAKEEEEKIDTTKKSEEVSKVIKTEGGVIQKDQTKELLN